MMLLIEMNIEGKPPLWASLIKNGLKKGQKFFFASGANEITGVLTLFDHGFISCTTVILYLAKEGEPAEVLKHLPRQQTYTIQQKSFDNWTIISRGNKKCLVMNSDSQVRDNNLRETVEKLPLWASLIKNGLAKDVKFFYGGKDGKGNNIVGIATINHSHVGTFSGPSVVLMLERGGDPARHLIPMMAADLYTLKRVEDGFSLRLKSNRINEDVTDPVVVSMAKKILDKKQKIFFINRSGWRVRVDSITQSSNIVKNTIWYFNSATKQPLTWKSVLTIDKLRLMKDGDVWLLYDIEKFPNGPKK